MTRSIPITKPLFGPEEMAAVQQPLESGWVVQGPYVRNFEERFCTFTQAAHAVATSSCTTALHVAVAALGSKPGDEVIVPAFTWVSTANVVEYMGARPVFCDINLQTFNMDVALLAGLVTERTVGIIPVHLFGLCVDMDPVLALAQARGLWVLEDAACGFGARYLGVHAGLFGDAGCFSFHPRKSITTGEGGMITTARADLDTLCRSLRDHGATRTDFERHQGTSSFLVAEYNLLGYNVRMTDIQGALGCVQMDRAPAILAARTTAAQRYDELLADTSWLRPPVTPAGYEHGYQAYVSLYCPEEPAMTNVERLHQRRNSLMAALERRGIATRQGTHVAALQGFYAEKYQLRPEQFPNAYLADRLSLTLPLYPQMSADDQEFVVEMLKTSGELDW
ncbi:MAG: DegT/DnrJ/EryC1/StrS family aminotransferase [Thermomicrobiales bacterium]|nr:DegT/DnrJ/EryC1/StrS family aminotransferase [Thermomicrobiales bacterium]